MEGRWADGNAIRGADRRKAQHAGQIEDVAADNISYGEVTLASSCRDDGSDRLRQRGAGRHKGQTNHELADT